MIEQILHLSHEIDYQLRQDELGRLEQRFQEKKPSPGLGFDPSTFQPKSSTIFCLQSRLAPNCQPLTSGGPLAVTKTENRATGNLTQSMYIQ